MYELMENGSLETLLHGKTPNQSLLIFCGLLINWPYDYPLLAQSCLKLKCLIFLGPSHGEALTWHMRMKIALDAAR